MNPGIKPGEHEIDHMQREAPEAAFPKYGDPVIFS